MLPLAKVGVVLGLSAITAGLASAPAGSTDPDDAQAGIHHHHRQSSDQCHGAGCACPVCMALAAKAAQSTSSSVEGPTMGYVAAIAATSAAGVGLLGYSLTSTRQRVKS